MVDNKMNYGAKFCRLLFEKKLKSSGIKRLIEDALWKQGIRHRLAPGIRRHEWKSAHGIGKYYKSRTEQVIKPINVEIIMDTILEFQNLTTNQMNEKAPPINSENNGYNT